MPSTSRIAATSDASLIVSQIACQSIQLCANVNVPALCSAALQSGLGESPLGHVALTSPSPHRNSNGSSLLVPCAEGTSVSNEVVSRGACRCSPHSGHCLHGSVREYSGQPAILSTHPARSRLQERARPLVHARQNCGTLLRRSAISGAAGEES